MPAKSKAEANAAFLRTYKERLKKAIQSEKLNREAAVTSLRMSDGDQWTDKERKRREGRGRPILTCNLLEASVMQAVGDERHNHARVKVRPVSVHGDVKQAEIRAGIIKEVEYVSNAEAIYDYAHEMQCRGAYGAWRVLTRYCADNPFIQEIYLERMKNALTVLMDPDATDAQYADAKYGFCLEKISEKEFKEKYPGRAVSANPFFQIAGLSKERSYDKASVNVVEYYVIEEEDITYCQLSDGRVMNQEDAEKEVGKAKEKAKDDQAKLAEVWSITHPAEPLPDLPAILAIEDMKEGKTPKVYRYIMSDSEILQDKEAVPGEFIPIIIAKGKEYNVEGQTKVKSFVHNAIDPQRYYNYWITSTAEVISLAPHSPYKGTAKMFKGYEKDWAAANVENMPFLISNADPDMPGKFPERDTGAPVPTAMLAEVQQAEGMVRKAMGVGNRDIGEVGPERSGTAIRQIQKPGDIGAFVFVDNLNRAIQHSGRVINSMIPEVYDTRRDIRTRKEDGTEHFTPINIPAGEYVDHLKENPTQYGKFRKPDQLKLDRFIQKNGPDALYNSTTSGKFEVMIDTGPNYATQRQESSENLIKMAQFDKRLMQIAPDVVYLNQDFLGASDISKRYRKTLPQGLVELEEGEEPAKPLPPPPQVQVMLAKQQNEMAKTQVKQMELQIKQAELQIKKLQALKEAQEETGNVRTMLLKLMMEIFGPGQLGQTPGAMGISPLPGATGGGA